MDAQNFEVVRNAARATNPDFYLSALLAPRASREDLIALAAFAGDIDRIVATVTEPALAEIRLQWWREAISNAEDGTLTGNPLADALNAAIQRHKLPPDAFDRFLSARAEDLYADQVPGEVHLHDYLEAADAARFRWAARCIPGADPAAPLYAAAGDAYGRARLLTTYARLQARGRCPFPGRTGPAGAIVAAEIPAARAALAKARASWREAATPDRRACLPLGTVAAYLAAVQRSGHDPARFIAEISPLDRVWRIWSARVLGRV